MHACRNNGKCLKGRNDFADQIKQEDRLLGKTKNTLFGNRTRHLPEAHCSQLEKSRRPRTIYLKFGARHYNQARVSTHGVSLDVIAAIGPGKVVPHYSVATSPWSESTRQPIISHLNLWNAWDSSAPWRDWKQSKPNYVADADGARSTVRKSNWPLKLVGDSINQALRA